jgi:type II secretory pathway pseudopilin PulG
MRLVVLLMGIVAGAAVVNLKDRQDSYALGAAARDLAAAIRFAAAQARIEGVRYRLMWDGETNGYRVEVRRVGQSEWTPAEGLVGLPRRLAKGVSVSEVRRGDEMTTDGMEFEPDGSGWWGVIELRSRSGQVMNIRIMPWTGQVLNESNENRE